MDSYILDNGNLRLRISKATGVLEGLTAVKTGWCILDRPELGLSFRLLIPLDDRRSNQVFGEDQALTSATVSPAGDAITLVWDSVNSEPGGRLPVRVTLNVALRGDQVVFSPHIDNQSPYVVENVYCPYLGGVRPAPDSEWFRTFTYGYASAVEWDLWPRYQNVRGYYGVDYPTQFGGSMNAGTPASPYCLLRSRSQGLYAGVAEPSSELTAWHTELRPGWENSMDSRVPSDDTISGHPVDLRFAAVHVPFLAPGETRSLAQVVLQAYEGDWQAGTDIYTRWRDSWMTPAAVPDWVQEPHAWQQLHINSPEDELRLRFADLPRIGEDCARHGVKAIQLVGWNDGGQDQGNPSHDPDPRLGTSAELQEAIAQIQTMGVKVILFTKFVWADRATDWFRRELHKLAIKDPYGDYYHFWGYQYQTATQLLDINTKRLIPMCFLSEEYLKVCEQEFQKILDLGADGMLFDECLHHSPALLCFDESHGHRRGAPVYAHDRYLIERFRRLAVDRPDFLFAGEACYDWEMEQYQLSYHRSENRGHVALSRYMLPAMPFMTAVTGFNDRNMVNQCLLNRYIISYEPFNFKGRLDDYPLTLAYGKAMDQLRTELREYFWDGIYRDSCGASVTTENGAEHRPFSVFRHRDTGAEGLVICNYQAETVAVEAALDSGSPKPLSQYRLVDDPTWRSVTDGITIPPHSAVVVI